MGRLLIQIILILAASVQAYGAGAAKVLVVHSYHETQQNHVVPMSEGIEEALAGLDTDIRYYHMDTKRKNSEAWKIEAGKCAAAMVGSFAPDVVITMDDNAQKYFAAEYALHKESPAFVFGGVNADPAKYGFPSENVTGVLERPNILESFQLLQKIVPEVRRVVIISDRSPTTNPVAAYTKTLDLPVEVLAFEQVSTLAEWQEVLDRYDDEVDGVGLYVLRTVARSDIDPQKVPESELLEILNSEYKWPTVAFFDSAAEAGVLCAVSVSMREQGVAAGVLAKKILQGAQPAEFTPEPTRKGRIQLNLAIAEDLGIEIKYNVIKRADVVIR